MHSRSEECSRTSGALGEGGETGEGGGREVGGQGRGGRGWGRGVGVEKGAARSRTGPKLGGAMDFVNLGVEMKRKGQRKKRRRKKEKETNLQWRKEMRPKKVSIYIACVTKDSTWKGFIFSLLL
mmetsp:Transcript_35634/g.55610  ORF Transcript_35634/g.55610 Transcript_35634/m.55610 type:complete len:124 (-) Transcript_35634:320-691(-)